MHARALSPIAFALFVAGSAAAAAGPSFDCHTDRSPTEQAICGDPELGDLDSEMARLYFQIANDSSGRYYRRLKRDQRDWLKDRDDCGAHVGCLRAVYRDRIRELRDVLGPQD